MTAITDFKSAVAAAVSGTPLSADDMSAAMDLLLRGETSPVQAAAFLTALRMRGETPEELAAAARAMREKSVKVDAPAGAIDTCGTGGDGAGTYNISTAVAFVVAGCGVPVAKHGNKAASSKSGAADVLTSLGVAIGTPEENVAACLREANVCFMFAQKHHPAMKHVGPVRADLGVRTMFNMLGPLTNPAGAKRQLMGVYDESLVETVAEVLKRLNSDSAWVVHGSDGLDELTTTGPSKVAELKHGAVRVFDVTPEDAGLPRASTEDLKGGTPEENAEALRAVLDSESGAYRDIVLLNSAAALIVAGKAEDLKAGAAMAADAIASGKAKAALDKLIEVSNR